MECAFSGVSEITLEFIMLFYRHNFQDIRASKCISDQLQRNSQKLTTTDQPVHRNT